MMMQRFSCGEQTTPEDIYLRDGGENAK